MKEHDVVHVADIAHHVVLYLLVCEDGLFVPHIIYKLFQVQTNIELYREGNLLNHLFN